jgi:outer membrane protein TolC
MVGVGLPADLITRRADVRRSEMQYAAAVARIGAAAAQKYPRLSLSGSLTFQTDTAGGLFDTDAMIYSLGPSLSFPLFDGGRIDRTVRVRQSQADQACLILRQTLLEAVKDVEDAAAGVMQNQQRVAHLTATVNYAKQRVKLAERLYKTGLGSLTQLIDAQHELVDINDSLVVARQTELGGIVTLYRSLGGGWDSVSLGQTSYVANKGGIEK